MRSAWGGGGEQDDNQPKKKKTKHCGEKLKDITVYHGVQ